MFRINIGLNEIKTGMEVSTRKAVRCIAFNKEGKVLMIKTNRGDYKFPGGGIEYGETIREALAREFLEETGFSLLGVLETIGIVEEMDIDKYDNSKVFIMTSTYIKCMVDISSRVKQKLDEYEKEQDFKVKFVSVNEAFLNNMDILNKEKEINSWVYREMEVLKELLKLDYL